MKVFARGSRRIAPRAPFDKSWVRASASQSVDLGCICLVESYQKTLENGIHSLPAWRSAQRKSVENKPSSSLVLSLGKTLSGSSPSLYGRQVVVGPSNLPVVVARSNRKKLII